MAHVGLTALTAIPTNHARQPVRALGVLRTGSANYYRGALGARANLNLWRGAPAN